MKISPDSTNVSQNLAKILTDMGEDQQVRGPDSYGRHSTCKWSVILVKIGFWDENPATWFDTSGFKGQDPLHVGWHSTRIRCLQVELFPVDNSTHDNKIRTPYGRQLINTSITRNYYPKPSPLDIQFEEWKSWMLTQTDALYEWNIDGLSPMRFWIYYLKWLC